jgi:plasmid stability protein
MLDAFTAALEACDPSLGRFRAYRIEAGTDLLGDWLVDVTYGRIGSPGRTVRHVASGEAEARRIVRRCLQRRRTAPKRIGVAYQLTDLADPGQWITATLAANTADYPNWGPGSERKKSYAKGHSERYG